MEVVVLLINKFYHESSIPSTSSIKAAKVPLAWFLDFSTYIFFCAIPYTTTARTTTIIHTTPTPTITIPVLVRNLLPFILCILAQLLKTAEYFQNKVNRSAICFSPPSAGFKTFKISAHIDAQLLPM